MPAGRPKKRNRLSSSDAAAHLLALRKAETNFTDFVRLIEPRWTLAPFQLELLAALDALEKDKLGYDNLLITMPPRHAKSTFATVFFPSYFLARDPSRFVMSSSYNAGLATDFGRQVRAIVENPSVAQAFPHFELSKESRAADVWRTTDMGAYFAVGLDGTTSGRPANLLIVDDPFKSRQDAESMTQRNRVWNFYISALSTRLQPDNSGHRPKQVMILTRWHPDDIAGRLMQSEDWKEGRWKHINFPALTPTEITQVPRYELPEDHPQYLDRASCMDCTIDRRSVPVQQYKALWPERFDVPTLLRRKRLNEREFSALYQQEPYIQGGNLLKTEWWRFYPSDLNPTDFVSLIIAVDTAYKKGQDRDYSVAVTAGVDSVGDIYILDVMRLRVEFPELKQRLIRLNAHWRGKGLRGIYVEDRASGHSLIQELRRESGLSVLPHKVVNDKLARATAVLPLIEGGRVYLPQSAPWLDDFIEECVSFPGGTYDDQVDATVMALDVLSKTATSLGDWGVDPNLSLSLNHVPHTTFGPSLNSTLNKPKLATPPRWRGWGL